MSDAIPRHWQSFLSMGAILRFNEKSETVAGGLVRGKSHLAIAVARRSIQRTAWLIFSNRKRTRPLSRVILERVRKRPAQAASRSASVSEPYRLSRPRRRLWYIGSATGTHSTTR